MTRENKLALVLGFGLILFVGILVSDHFSTAQRQQSADLLPSPGRDPLMESRREDPTLLHYERPRPETRARPLAVHAGALTLRRDLPPQTTLRPGEVDAIRMPDLQNPVTPGSGPRDASATRHHVVRARESLTSICRIEYGDATLAPVLAARNELVDPNTLEVGQRLVLPPVATLRDGAAPARSEPAPAPTYTVKGGDTLSEIAQTLLGSAAAWQRLYDHNKDVIRDPDALLVGTRLKVPR